MLFFLLLYHVLFIEAVDLNLTISDSVLLLFHFHYNSYQGENV